MIESEDLAEGFAEEFAYKPASERKAPAKRGKKAEGDLSKAFDKLKKESVHFDYERLPDAFSTRGAFLVERTGDFLVFYRSVTLVVECKEVKHAFRLPAANLSSGSRDRMRRRTLAGIASVVVVRFSVTGLWRIAPVSYFGTRSLGSWDMSDLPTFNDLDIVKEIIKSCSPFSTTSTSASTAPQEPQSPPA